MNFCFALLFFQKAVFGVIISIEMSNTFVILFADA